MIYIKLEENRDKFMTKYQNMPQMMKKILFQSKQRKGKFEISKVDNRECIVLPEVNEKVVKRLKLLANIRCWNNICISDNLRTNKQMLNFAKDSGLKIMDGRWLMKNMTDKILEYMADLKGEMLANQEIGILCHRLDETISEKIREICQKVKICHVLTNQLKQFRNLEEKVYQEKGIVINVSNNYKKVLSKSSLILNFDFSKQDLEKCVFAKDVYMFQVAEDIYFEKKEFEGKNFTFLGIDVPQKYQIYQETWEGFQSSILYESLIYKRTSYRNIQKELLTDEVKIAYLQDENYKIVKKTDLILPKTLDKMRI